jgi:hypothetical protein
MAKVYSVTVRYMRRIQAREYEPAEAEVTVQAELVGGDTPEQAISETFALASQGVHIALGLPPDVELAPRTGATTAAVSPRRRKNAPATSSSATVQQSDTADIPSTTSAPAAAAQPAQPAAQTAQPAAKVEANVIDPTAGAAQPSQPAAQTTALPGDFDLAKYVGELVRSGKLNSNTVKGLYPEYGVQRIADLKPEQKAPFKAKVDALVQSSVIDL